MIEVLLNKPEFEYDIHSLIKAFFPEQYVGVSAEKKEYDEKIDIRMQVNYGEDTIQITWQEIVHANEDAQANEKRSVIPPSTIYFPNPRARFTVPSSAFSSPSG